MPASRCIAAVQKLASFLSFNIPPLVFRRGGTSTARGGCTSRNLRRRPRDCEAKREKRQMALFRCDRRQRSFYFFRSCDTHAHTHTHTHIDSVPGSLRRCILAPPRAFFFDTDLCVHESRRARKNQPDASVGMLAFNKSWISGALFES